MAEKHVDSDAESKASNKDHVDEWRTMDEERCEQVLEVDPFDNYARFRLSEILIGEDRDLTVAERLVKSIMTKDPQFMRAECYELLGDIEYSEYNKRYEKAVEHYHKANALRATSKVKDAANVGLYVKLGRALEKLRDFDEAIAFLKKALRRDKNNFQALYRVAMCYIRNNMREEGIEALIKAHELNPEDIDTMLKLSEIYLRDDKKLDEAETIIKKVLVVDSLLPEANLNLGRVYEKKGMNDQALEQFKKGLKLS